MGYTSLGGTRDTLPNPRLVKPNSDGRQFHPAYELLEDDEERLGRDVHVIAPLDGHKE